MQVWIVFYFMFSLSDNEFESTNSHFFPFVIILKVLLKSGTCHLLLLWLNCSVVKKLVIQILVSGMSVKLRTLYWFYISLGSSSFFIVGLLSRQILAMMRHLILSVMLKGCLGKECKFELFSIIIFLFQITNLKQWICIPFHLLLSWKSSWRMGVV